MIGGEISSKTAGAPSEELCSFTRLGTQCRTPESLSKNTRKSVCSDEAKCRATRAWGAAL